MRCATVTVVLLVGAAALLNGDGGAVQFRKTAGPFIITLFSASSPLRAGPADLSVLVESAQTREPVLNATVSLTLHKPSGGAISTPATHAHATNKLLYASEPTLSEPGNWRVLVSVSLGPERADSEGILNVLPMPPAPLQHWPYFLVVPFLIGLFVLNQWLKGRFVTKSHRKRLGV